MLKTYLKQCKNLINSLSVSTERAASTKLKFIIGNEAADMDSMFSSILYGYYRSLIATKNKEIDTHYIPIINTRFHEIFSRFEVIHILKNLSYDVEDLLFVDRCDFKGLVQLMNSDIILVDHNIPGEHIKDLMAHITEVLDHHDDKTSIYKEGQLQRKTIEKIGSNTTIVFTEIYKDFKDIESKFETDIFWLILACILTDTFNLNPKEKDIRWVDKDAWACNTLVELLKDSKDFPEWKDNDGKINFNLISNSLGELKFNVDFNLKLGIEGMLLKDYKKFEYKVGKVGYCTIMVGIDDLLKKYSPEDTHKEMKKFIEKDKLDFLVCLFVCPKDKNSLTKLKREALIMWEKEEGLKELTKYLLNQKLELREEEHNFDPSCFKRLLDVDSVYTRKILEPLIAKYMN